ncbi:hypothetical protein D3C81_1405280 [compost metagenome]
MLPRSLLSADIDKQSCSHNTCCRYGDRPSGADSTVKCLNNVILKCCCSDYGSRQQPGLPTSTFAVGCPHGGPTRPNQCRNRCCEHDQIIMVEETRNAEEDHNRSKPCQPEQAFLMFLSNVVTADCREQSYEAERYERKKPAGLT